MAGCHCRHGLQDPFSWRSGFATGFLYFRQSSIHLPLLQCNSCKLKIDPIPLFGLMAEVSYLFSSQPNRESQRFNWHDVCHTFCRTRVESLSPVYFANFGRWLSPSVRKQSASAAIFNVSILGMDISKGFKGSRFKIEKRFEEAVTAVRAIRPYPRSGVNTANAYI